MRFVLAAYRKTRRRVQLENLLLLLARMLAVAALAFAVARPFASGDSPLAGLREERRDLVLVLDGSASMGLRGEVKTVHEEMIERATALIEDLDGPRGDQSAWSSPARAPGVPRDRPRGRGRDPRHARPSPRRGLRPGGGLRRRGRRPRGRPRRGHARRGGRAAVDRPPGRDLLRPAERDRRRRRGLRLDACAPALAERVARLDALEIKAVVEDLGVRALRPKNLSVSSVTLLGDQPRAGVPFDVAVEVSNHGDDEVLAERVALAVGGERLPSQRLDVPARGTAEAIFTVVLATPGHRALEASLEGDRLGVDDRRALVALAPRPLEVLLVNGAPAERIEEDELGYFGAVLEPPDDGLGGGPQVSPFVLTDLTAAELDSPDSPIERADVIVLANAPGVSAAVAARLQDRVAAGAGLVISLGDRLGDLGRWSEHLWNEDGTGLLPARLSRVVNSVRRNSYHRVLSFEEDPPRAPLLQRRAAASAPHGGAGLRLRPDARARAERARARDPRRPGGQPPARRAPVRRRPRGALHEHAGQRLEPDPRLREDLRPLRARARPARGARAAPSSATSPWATPSPSRSTASRGARCSCSPAAHSVPSRGTRASATTGAGTCPRSPATSSSARRLHRARRGAPARADRGPARRQRERPRPRHGRRGRGDPPGPRRRERRLGLRRGDRRRREPGGPGELWRWLAMAALAFLAFESLWGAYIGSRRRSLA